MLSTCLLANITNYVFSVIHHPCGLSHLRWSFLTTLLENSENHNMDILYWHILRYINYSIVSLKNRITKKNSNFLCVLVWHLTVQFGMEQINTDCVMRGALVYFVWDNWRGHGRENQKSGKPHKSVSSAPLHKSTPVLGLQPSVLVCSSSNWWEYSLEFLKFSTSIFLFSKGVFRE